MHVAGRPQGVQSLGLTPIGPMWLEGHNVLVSIEGTILWAFRKRVCERSKFSRAEFVDRRALPRCRAFCGCIANCTVRCFDRVVVWLAWCRLLIRLMALKTTMTRTRSSRAANSKERFDLSAVCPAEQFTLHVVGFWPVGSKHICTVRLRNFKLCLMSWHVLAVLRMGPLVRDADLRFAGPEVVKRKPEMGEHWSQGDSNSNGKQIGDFDLGWFQARARERISSRRMSLEEFWAPFERVPQQASANEQIPEIDCDVLVVWRW